jgi:hypothetical protein
MNERIAPQPAPRAPHRTTTHRTAPHRTAPQHIDELDGFLALSEHIKQIRQQTIMQQEESARADAPPPPPPPPPAGGSAAENSKSSNSSSSSSAEFDKVDQEMQSEQSHMPMNEEELSQVQFVIQQLWRLIINSQSDVREDYDIQNLLHVVMNMVPRLMVRECEGAGVRGCGAVLGAVR